MLDEGENFINKSESGQIKERRKIEIDPHKSSEAIQKEFNVSRTTAWRIKRRGWLFVNYHQRLIDPDREWNNKNEKAILDAAEKGVKSLLYSLAVRSGYKNIDEFLRPHDLEDVIQFAAQSIMEVSGLPDRDIEAWRVSVAKTAVYNFLDRMINKARWQSYSTFVDTIIEKGKK